MNKTTMIALGVAVGFFLLIGMVAFSGYIYVNGVRNQIVTFEISLSAEDQSLQAELDNYLTGVNNNLTFVKFDTQAKRDLAFGMIEGVYGGQGVQSTAFVNTFNRLYPELRGDTVKTQQVFDALNSGRERFKNALQARADKLRAYRTYRDSDIFRSLVAKSILNAPTLNLRVIRGRVAYTGAEAERQIETIVSSKETQEAMKEGTLQSFKTQ